MRVRECRPLSAEILGRRNGTELLLTKILPLIESEGATATQRRAPAPARALAAPRALNGSAGRPRRWDGVAASFQYYDARVGRGAPRRRAGPKGAPRAHRGDSGRAGGSVTDSRGPNSKPALFGASYETGPFRRIPRPARPTLCPLDGPAPGAAWGPASFPGQRA